jgi:DNA repair exonuclease SbcCD nuclease subunit
MPKIYGLMADLHLHLWSSFSSTLDSGINSRLDGLLGEIHRCAKEVHLAGGNTVVMAGDVFHVRGSVAPSVLNPTKDKLKAIHEEFGTQFILIPGNHDLEGKNTTRLGAAVTALESDHVRIITEPVYVDEVDAYLIPWYEKTGDLMAELDRLKPEHGEYQFDAIIHAPIDGVIPGLPAHGLTPEGLAKLGYRHIFSGHYHHHKAFEGGAVSIGALAHHTWSDVGTKAGFLLVDSETGSYTWRKSHLPEFIDLAKLVSELYFDPSDIPLMVDGHYVRVRVEASKSKEVEEARAELLGHGARAVLVQAEPKPPAELVRASHSVSAGASLEVSVGEFIKGMKDVADSAAVAAAALSVLGSVAA